MNFMQRFLISRLTLPGGILVAVLLILAATASRAVAAPLAQDATPVDEITIPYVECCRNETFANLRTGPSAMDYPGVGMLTLGEKAKVIGKSKASIWLEILYPSAPGGTAWVYAELVTLYSGENPIPVVEAPPTPTPKSAATIDPTFVAQLAYSQPTRLPTFTPATMAPTITLPAAGTASGGGGLPPAVFIIGLLTLGTFGAVLSAVVRR
jgi:uncharacterized protein YraI